MSDISAVQTKVAATSSAQTGKTASGSTSGVFTAGLGGGNFWDMIASQLGVSMGEQKSSANGVTNALLEGTDVKSNTKASSDNPLALLQIALSAQTVDEQGNIVLNAPETDPATLQKQLDLTNNIINQLKNLVPDNSEKEGIIGSVLSKLQAKSDTLQASLSALENPVISKETSVEDIPLPVFIALGLSPSEIAQVSDKIKSLEDKLGREITVEDLIAGVGGIIAPAPETATLALASSAPKTTAPNQNILDGLNGTAEPTDDLAAQLNALDVGGEEESDEQKLLDLKSKSDDSVMNGKVKNDAATFKDNLVNLLNNTAKLQTGEMTVPSAYFATDADATIQQFGVAAHSALTFGNVAQAANMIANSATAGQPHPATQMVAATLTKAGKNGDDNIMTLRLDPPELGNVNIRLQFGKDKMVKAIISAEKPETYMMLQRDAHSLERALQSVGLETGTDGLTFELQDQGSFAQDNNGQGGGEKNFGGGNANSQDADGVEIIQSSVTWQVDPSTGQVRYNIFA